MSWSELAAILVSRGGVPSPGQAAEGEPDREAARAPARTDPSVLFLVIASGFGTVALEVLYTRLLVNITDSSVFSFSLMLATFLVFLGLASLVVSWVVDRVDDPWRLLAWTQSLAVIAILVAPTLLRTHLGEREAPSVMRPTFCSCCDSWRCSPDRRSC